MTTSSNAKTKPAKKTVPKSFICPITQEIMLDPVMVTSSGKTYERKAIEEWLEENPQSNSTEFLQTCLSGDKAEIMRCLKLGATISASDDQGNTALHYLAARSGNETLANLLIARGVT